MASGRTGIVTGGTWCADHNKLVEHWPGEEEVVEILTEEVRGGGSACNLAIDLKRLDPRLPVSTIGIVGDDEDGRILLSEAHAAGIECSRLSVITGTRTNYTDAYSSRVTGRRTHLFHAGTNAVLSPDHFEFSDVAARILHLGLPGVHAIMDRLWHDDDNGWVCVLKKARHEGIETNLELCSVPADRLFRIVRPCLPHLDFLVVNDFEIAAIAGHHASHEDTTDVAACLAAAKAVIAAGPMRLVAVHFPAGAIVVARDGQELHVPSVVAPSDQIVGTNGAGDAFAAGLIYGLHEGWELEEAVRLGHSAAAASLRGVGTTDAVQSWQQCLSLAAKWGWRERI